MPPSSNPAIAAAVAEAKEERSLARREADVLPVGLELDWRKSQFNALATMLVSTPFARDRDGAPVYLGLPQAGILAWTCMELEISPFQNHAWFNPNTNKVAITVEGHREIARKRGYKIAPPKFTEIERPFTEVPKERATKIAELKKVGFDKDYGVTCEIKVLGFDNPASYTAWLSEWFMIYNPNWTSRRPHMLRVRAEGKALEQITGVGTSGNMDEDEKFLATNEPVRMTPQIEVTPVEVVHAEVPNQ